MIYVKSVLAGLAAVTLLEMVLMALTVIITSGMGGYWEFQPRSLLTWPVILPNVVSFAAGFWWMIRRLSSARSTKT